MQTPKIHRIPTRNGNLFSCVYGDLSKSSNIPLLTVHGGPGYCSDTLTVLSALSEANNRPVIVYDQLGCGQSDDPHDESTWNIVFYLQELQQVINYYQLEQYDLLGHSWGGTLACSHAVEQPAGLRKLILSSPLISTPDWMKDTARRKRELPLETQAIIKQHEAAGTVDSDAYQEAIGIFNAKFLCRLNPKPTLMINAFEKFNLDIYLAMWGPSEFNATGNLKHFSEVENLSKIKASTLLCSGFYDEIQPDTMQSYCDKLENGKLHIFMQSSHTTLLEEPKEYLRVVEEFLQVSS